MAEKDSVFYERLKEACRDKGVKLYPTVVECGGTTGSVNGWKNGVYPNSGIVVKLAKKLGVTTDYLLGVDVKPESKPVAPYSTAEDVALWFLARNRMEETCGGDAMTNETLQKLLYFAQGCTLAITGAPLFEEDMVALQYGPSIKSIRQLFESYTVDPDPFGRELRFLPQVEGILECVFQDFGQLSAWKLRNIILQHSVFRKTPKMMPISKQQLKVYFRNNYIEN